MEHSLNPAWWQWTAPVSWKTFSYVSHIKTVPSLDYDKLESIFDQDVCLGKTDIVCDPDLYELCVLMGEHHLQASHDAAEATRL